MSDGTKREDDTLSGGSELITLCLELTHKSIAAKEEEYEPVRGGSLTVSATLRLLTLNLKKKDKGIPRLVAPSLEIKSWDEQKQVGGVGGENDESSSSLLLSATQISRWEEERK